VPEAIFEDGPVDTPYVYTVTGHGSVTPRACAAVYNGAGAGGNFVPAVIFRSQEGHVIARAILQSTITAGDDAEVSWFPGVKPAQTGGGHVTLPTYGSLALSVGDLGDSPYSVAAGGTSNIRFVHQFGGAAGIFTFSPSTTYSDTITLESTDYIYVFHAAWKWGTIGITTQVVIDGPPLALDGTFLWGALDVHGETFANTFVTGGPFIGDNLFGVDTKTYICDTVPQTITLNALHNSGTAKNIIEATMVCVAYKVF
jgi:hypothetical protein